MCEEYSSPPCERKDGELKGTFGQSKYIGPVRRAPRFRNVVTVEIPSAFAEGDIGYVDLANGDEFARRVPREEVKSWKGKEWVDDVGD